MVHGKQTEENISDTSSVTESESSVTEPPSHPLSPIQFASELLARQETEPHSSQPGMKRPRKLSTPSPSSPLAVQPESSSSSSFQVPPSPQQRYLARQVRESSCLREHKSEYRGHKRVYGTSDKENSPHRTPKRHCSGLQNDSGNPIKVDKRVVVIERTNFEKEVIKCLYSIDSNLKKLVPE
ncbi:hypothetical protein M422DRAFT_264561 [Sphaerobolus stellatus SS14]|uniref:Uncharacterized protein n=1 Tax=Sphaerobolus stellatus (strain SS14) TaxID=990650 RepID=A0A0C9UW33_SPHS4|nr:hypothetical protein M422DRAFT_264561 [Sphaerobolus stellatus SS14]